MSVHRSSSTARHSIRVGAITLLCALAWVSLVADSPGRRPGPVNHNPRERTATVWAVGDGADGGPATLQVGQLVERGKPDRFLYLGDVYEHGTALDYSSHYALAFGVLAPLTAPTPGNHEWQLRAEGYLPYWRKIMGRSIPDYYKFSIGGWEIFSLNSETDHGKGSRQVRWLRSKLRKAGTCRLAFWHRPRYSGGGNGDQVDVAPLWNALLRGGRTWVPSALERPACGFRKQHRLRRAAAQAQPRARAVCIRRGGWPDARCRQGVVQAAQVRVLIRLVAALGLLVAAVLGGLACGGSVDQRKRPTSIPSKDTSKLGAGLASSSSNQPATVWAVGDAAAEGQYKLRVARLVARGKPDRFLYLGDVYEDGTAAEYRNNYTPAFGRFDRITAPTPGNHEWPAHAEGYQPYWRAVIGSEIPDYYRFTIGGWEVLSLNSESAHGEGSSQLRWLRSTVSRGRGTCTLAFWHRPRYSYGEHGDQPDVSPFWKALRGRATLVVNGHEHNMQRWPPREGITELVSGAGGRGIYRMTPEEKASLPFGNDTDFGALDLRLAPGRAEFRFVAVDGRTLDSGKLRCARSGRPDSQPVSAS
jgi:calcineurin-like phosphoesterase family protein